jgi:hypothetical protein
MIVPSDNQAKLYSLFGYETGDKKNSVLWSNPMYFAQATGQGASMLDENFVAWKNTKRDFTTQEILSGIWIKIGDTGHSFIMKCHQDGKFSEHNIFDEHEVYGTWKLMGGVFRTNIQEYELNIVANKNGSIHSGIEFTQNKPVAYFKVIHLE